MWSRGNFSSYFFSRQFSFSVQFSPLSSSLFPIQWFVFINFRQSRNVSFFSKFCARIQYCTSMYFLFIHKNYLKLQLGEIFATNFRFLRAYIEIFSLVQRLIWLKISADKFKLGFLKLVFCYKNCSDLLWEIIVLVTENFFFFLKFEAEGREFAKSLRSLELFVWIVKGRNNFWLQDAFLTCSWRVLRYM